MAANRRAPTAAVDITMGGTPYSDDIDAEIVRLYQMAVNNLTNVAGTANAITADASPALTAAPVDKQCFLLVPVAANTTAVTLNPGQGGAKALVDSAGAALESGDLAIGEPVLFYKDATADNFRQIGKTLAQITRLITGVVGTDQAFIYIDKNVIVASVAQVEILFTASAFQEIEVIMEGLSPVAATSQLLEVTLRHAGGAIVILLSPSGTFSSAAHNGTFHARFLLDNISATGEYHGALEGVSNTTLRARTTAEAQSATPPDRIRVRGTQTNLDQGRVTVRGKPIPA